MSRRNEAAQLTNPKRDEKPRHEKSHLQEALENTKYVLLLSQIYEMATSSSDPICRLDSIRRLIDTHNREKSMRLKPSIKTQGTMPSTGPPTPPLSSADSTSLEALSQGSSSCEVKGGSNTEESDVCCQGDEDDDKNRGALKTLIASDITKTSKNTGCKSGTGPEKQDVADDNEFSLEEELEGIADAPAKDRAAMRAAMQEKENSRRAFLQELAAKKRRLAEKEGLRLQRTLKNTVAVPSPVLPAQRMAASGRAQAFTVGPTVTPTATPISKQKSPSRVQAIARRAMDEEDDDDEHGERSTRQQSIPCPPSNKPTEASSPSIISITGSPPRNVDRFGIEFAPTNISVDHTKQESHRRSVLIQNIPHSFTIHTVLSHVHGGTVIDAKLFPEILSLGSGQTAVIVFARSSEASLCCRTTRESFQSTEAGKGVNISLLPMPTYPTRESLAFEEGGAEFSPEVQRQTRCLLIDGFPRQHIKELCIELHLDIRHVPLKLQVLEELWFEEDTLHINFTSIREAVKAYNTVKYFYFGKFSLQTRYGIDPCSLPIEAGALGNTKLASHGFVGLKSLLETVGLAVYSRNYRDAIENDGNQKNSLKAICPVGTKGYASMKNCSQLVDDCSNESISTTTNGTMGTITPWTKELMRGLELL